VGGGGGRGVGGGGQGGAGAGGCGSGGGRGGGVNLEVVAGVHLLKIEECSKKKKSHVGSKGRKRLQRAESGKEKRRIHVLHVT